MTLVALSVGFTLGVPLGNVESGERLVVKQSVLLSKEIRTSMINRLERMELL